MPVFRPAPSVLARQVGDELVLVNMDRNTIFSLNITAARIWELWAEGRSQAEAVDELVLQFDVTRETAEAESARLLAELRREGLGDFADSDPAP